MLVALYLLIAADLKLSGVKAASLIVTLYGLVYCLGSYAAGVLSDRINRRDLLGVGLIGNAAAILCIGLTRQYEMILALGMLAGLFGTLFHPAANALVPAHYPKSPGMAIGILGIGAGLGFFAGPKFAGWSAAAGTWQWGTMADWQRPCVELGMAGIIFGILFLLTAREAPSIHLPKSLSLDAPIHPPLGPSLRWKIIGIALILGLRDFSGIATISLTSIYLQKALGMDVKKAGSILGLMMLISVLMNPLSVWLSPGRRRLAALAGMLLLGGFVLAMVPHLPGIKWVLPVLCAFQSFHLGSYAVSDAAILERVPAAVRGRVVGLFLMLAGTIASSSPWLMGLWTDAMPDATDPRAYAAPFAVLGAAMCIAAFSVPLIRRLGQADETAIKSLTPIAPATMEPIG